jgi:dihydroorotase
MYDLLLRGGRVIDPAQDLDGTMDLAIQAGKIATLRRDIAAGEARRVVDVTGKIVTPGLVDLHTHVYWGGTSLGVQPDRVAAMTGVTTFVDAGSAGAGNFIGFKSHVIDRSQSRIFAFLHVAYQGLGATIYDPQNYVILGETFDLRYAMLEPAIQVGAAFPDLIRGIKVRTSVESSGDQGMRALRLALQAAEALGKPVMVHVGVPPPSRREILSLLRPGDILTHAFRGEPNSPLDRHGDLLPEMIQARERGVVMDLAHGGSSFSWAVTARLLEQGFLPDVISTDLHRGLNVKTSGWSELPARTQPLVMSKVLSLGMELKDVIRASTYTPAQVIGCADQVGSLRQGRAADVAVFELQEGRFEFDDWFDGPTVGNRQLVPVLTVLGGQVLDEPA